MQNIEVNAPPLAMQYQEFMERTLRLVSETLDEYGELPPTVILIKGKHIKKVLLIDTESDESKDGSMLIARANALVVGADYAVCFFESWAVNGENRVAGLEVRQHENRYEVVVLGLETPTGTMYGHGRLQRDDAGKPSIKRWDFDAVSAGGRMFGVLPGNY